MIRVANEISKIFKQGHTYIELIWYLASAHCHSEFFVLFKLILSLGWLDQDMIPYEREELINELRTNCFRTVNVFVLWWLIKK